LLDGKEGSTVRVRQRACTKCLLIQALRRLRRKRLGRKIELRQSLRKLDHLVGKGRTHLVPLPSDERVEDAIFARFLSQPS